MGFLETMQERGMLAQVTHEDELRAHLTGAARTAYAGFDPTADSLHVGHLLPVLGLRRWQQAGHRVIVLLGGGTALVGDPTGKTDMRQMADAETINARAEHFKKQLAPFIDFTDPKKGIVLNNADWLLKLQYLPLLREFGVHFSVNRMLTADSVKLRLEKGLSFLEFNYMILQSYDFYHLNKHEDCSVQLGGDDQWSNMLGGMELVRRKEQKQAFCVTLPLLVTSEGKKMGKTEKGAVWIDPNLTPPFDFFQYFRNIDDSMVEQCLFYFSDLPVAEVKRLGALRDREINDAKIVLAFEATKLVHGEEEANKAKSMAAGLFAGGAGGKPEAPEALVAAKDLPAGDAVSVVDVLVLAGIFASKSEARRLIEGGGLSLDNEKITSTTATLDVARLKTEDGVLVRKGKKSYHTLKLA
ncbi:MAG TPA: tyrosine--tRNA ligase [Oligoflexus sp.]|uniref:tyrosine--tRNA ligase n=1 Tax=Oligoflexus sp. TaxID=1971216 RepID=UPI002D3E8253|nr:tyrosine--tRNA ligase [Oligoflexus sp.]HYX32157.1 tyrosine--tRNA ligase [Oligoflexus sp.]